MSGTKIGAAKAREANLKRDPDFYKKIGAKGGSRRVPKGFALNLDRARLAGAKGGKISRRPKSTKLNQRAK